MSTRSLALALLGSALLIAGCSATSVSPAAEPSASTGPSPIAPASPASEPSLGPGPSAAASRTPAASGVIDPANFTSTVDNPWFPLTPGAKFTYTGTKDGRKAVETFTVTTGTKVIAGVTCVVLDDQVSLGGVPAERLLGYYAQDRGGNVWYFGEDMFELDASGHVVGNGDSWHAGVDKAPPALFMEASPTVGDSFAHDYTKNDFAVVSLAEAVKVPYGAFTDALVTKEWSPLEPTIETRKYYVRGLGLVRDVAVKGPTEELVLVKVDRP
jgi:hypothetical protein